jgi:hypothetical protein
VNPEKTKCMLMSRYQSAKQKHTIKIRKRSFEDATNFKYCMHEEIKSRPNLVNACYHWVQSLLSSRLLSRNLKYIKL